MKAKKWFTGLSSLTFLASGIIYSDTVIAKGGDSAPLSSKFFKENLNNTSNSSSAIGKISAASIALSSVFGVILVPTIVLAITALAEGSKGVRGLLLKFKLKKLWFALEALVAKFWFNRSNYKGKFANIPILYWYGNNCFINSAFYTFVAPENYQLYKSVSEMTAKKIVEKIDSKIKNEKWKKFESYWDSLEEKEKKKEAERIIDIAKVCKNFLDIVSNSSQNNNYNMDNKFSLVGKFKFWQLNEEDGSYKAKEKKLLSQKDSEIREDYEYGKSSLALERLGGYKKNFDFYSLNKNGTNAKEQKLLIPQEKNSFYKNSSETEKEKLLILPKNSFSKSEENDFGFEKLEKTGEDTDTEAKSPPYFSILADALKNDKNNFSNDFYELFGIYNLEDLKKFHTYKGKLLTSISSGKNGGAFTVQPKYKFNEENKEYELVSWLVLDCHGGPHKILKTFEELYNFLEFGEFNIRFLYLRYTDSKNFEQDDLTKKYYLVDSNEKYHLSDSIIITE